MWFIKLGSAIKGPFSEDQLAGMLTRGEFSKSHLVSSDRQRWEQAGFLVELLERRLGATTSGRTTGHRIPSVETGPKSWYYSNNGQKQGPLTYSEVKTLIRDKVITAETNIFSDQTRAWVPARDEPLLSSEFKKKPVNRAVLLASGVVSTGILVVAGFAAILLNSSPEPDNPIADGKPPVIDVSPLPDPENPSKPENVVVNVPQPDPSRPTVDFPQSTMSEVMEQKLTNSTGLVYLCTRCSIGTRVLDLTPLSSGTCFVVTKEGGVLTNRHVVDFMPKLSSNEKLAKFIAAERATCEKGGGQYSIGIYVFFGELKWELKILQMSDRYDLAIGKIERNKDCEFLSLSKSSSIRRTQKVYTVGFPGLASEAATSEDVALQDLLLRSKTSINEMVLPYEKIHTISDGSVERVTEFTNRVSVIQHTAKISQGNSGGPLLRADGTVIGINTFGKKDQDSLGVYLYSPEISQMRREIDEYVPGQVNWVE